MTGRVYKELSPGCVWITEFNGENFAFVCEDHPFDVGDIWVFWCDEKHYRRTTRAGSAVSAARKMNEQELLEFLLCNNDVVTKEFLSELRRLSLF